MPENTLTADIITITGHRDFTDVGSLYRGLDQTNAKQYYLGGARGIDTRALEYLGETRPGSIRTVVVPNRLSHQPAEARVVISKYATNIIELKNTGYNRYQLRNEFMVDRSQSVRAFYDYRPAGGTFNTIKYANSVGKPVGIWGMETVDINAYDKMSPVKFELWLNEMNELNVSEKCVKGIALNYLKVNAERLSSAYTKGILQRIHTFK